MCLGLTTGSSCYLKSIPFRKPLYPSRPDINLESQASFSFLLLINHHFWKYDPYLNLHGILVRAQLTFTCLMLAIKKLTIETSERRYRRCLDVFIVNNELISHISLVFLFIDLKQVNESWEIMCRFSDAPCRNAKTSLHKTWSFPLKISSRTWPNPQKTPNLVTFTEKNLNEELWSAIFYWEVFSNRLYISLD